MSRRAPDATTEKMDTRRKIVRDASTWQAPAGAVVAAGPFDPLLSRHAAQLEQLKQDAPALVVFITEPPEPLLPAQARAELVAALRCVDAVLFSQEPPPQAIDLTADHLEWREQLICCIAQSAGSQP
jgi:bifunctional ADP-heptose synthase (sugar kinase/adenylyltransferase)